MNRTGRHGAVSDSRATGPDAEPGPRTARAVAVAPPHLAARKGRGTPWNLAHRYEDWGRELDLDALETALTADAASGQTAASPVTELRFEPAGRILSRNESPDVPFEQALNPYRGCEHGCIYCYARPTHAYLGLSPGLDFETRLVAKPEAAERLRQTLARPGYRVSPINIGSATDAYQPVERRLGLTRAVLQVLCEARHPLTVVTKSAAVLRDIDLLADLARDTLVQVFITVTTLDPALARILEPRAASPARRLATVRALSAAGVPVAVNMAPVIPFLNEPEIERVAQAAGDAGARRLHYTVLRLPWEVAPLFRHWLQQHVPDRAERIMARVRELHGGRDYRADFSRRMKGQGLWADLIRQRMHRAARQHGLDAPPLALRCDLFRAPVLPQQRTVADSAAGACAGRSRVPSPAQAGLFDEA